MYLTQESDSSHGEEVGTPTYTYEADDEERKELSKRLLPPEATEAQVRQQAKTLAGSLICSCGSYVCPGIRIFGLPESVFRSEIEPIGNQAARDRRARELRS